MAQNMSHFIHLPKNHLLKAGRHLMQTTEDGAELNYD